MLTPTHSHHWLDFFVQSIIAIHVKLSKEYFDYGSLMIGPNGTKKWSGLVGAVESGDADFAVSAMTVTPQR